MVSGPQHRCNLNVSISILLPKRRIITPLHTTKTLMEPLYYSQVCLAENELIRVSVPISGSTNMRHSVICPAALVKVRTFLGGEDMLAVCHVCL